MKILFWIDYWVGMKFIFLHRETCLVTSSFFCYFSFLKSCQTVLLFFTNALFWSTSLCTALHNHLGCFLVFCLFPPPLFKNIILTLYNCGHICSCTIVYFHFKYYLQTYYGHFLTILMIEYQLCHYYSPSLNHFALWPLSLFCISSLPTLWCINI